jgi:hypothetical protein
MEPPASCVSSPQPIRTRRSVPRLTGRSTVPSADRQQSAAGDSAGFWPRHRHASPAKGSTVIYRAGSHQSAAVAASGRGPTKVSSGRRCRASSERCRSGAARPELRRRIARCSSFLPHADAALGRTTPRPSCRQGANAGPGTRGGGTGGRLTLTQGTAPARVPTRRLCRLAARPRRRAGALSTAS